MHSQIKNRTCEKVYKIVVCGTNFGRIYIQGIKKSSNCKLIGILSRGSLQSRQCADDNGVPLYTNICQLNSNDVDIVCIAVKSSITGGKGTEIALECLKKGINVIQEQPVHYSDMVKCYKESLKNNCYYMVNNFYSNLPAGKIMTECAGKLLNITEPLLIEAECSVQVLYPLLDIIGKMVGSITPYEIHKLGDKNGILSIIEGKINQIPLILKIENRMVPNDSDNYALLFHRLILFTNSGQLVMDNSIGEVFWEPRYFINKKDGILKFEENNIYSRQKVIEILNENCLQNTYKDVYEKLWPIGISNTLKEFLTLINDDKMKSRIQYQLNLCKMWNDVGTCIGPAQEGVPQKIVPINKKQMLM